MACCDTPSGATPQINYADLPDQTFCCMGRMAYQIASAAVLTLTGQSSKPWAEFNERDKLRLGTTAKELITRSRPPASKVEEVMVVVLDSMTTAA